MTRLSKIFFAALAALVLTVTCTALAHRAAVWNYTPAMPAQALTIEDVLPLFNFNAP